MKEINKELLPIKTKLITWKPLVLTEKYNELYQILPENMKNFDFSEATKSDNINYFKNFCFENFQ